MIIMIDIIVSILLIISGYIYISCYLNNLKITNVNMEVLSVDNKKIIYLISIIVLSVFLTIFFNRVYSDKIIYQLKSLILVLILFPIAVIDFKVNKIPNQLILFALGLRVIIYIVEYINYPMEIMNIIKSDLLGAFIIGGFFFLLLLIFKNSIGMGDVKLFVVMGLYLGFFGILNAVFYSLIVSFFVSVSLLITKKKGKRDTIAFGPSILIGTVISIILMGV